MVHNRIWRQIRHTLHVLEQSGPLLCLANKHVHYLQKTPDIPQRGSHPCLTYGRSGSHGIQVKLKWKPQERAGGGQVAEELVLRPTHLCKHHGRAPQRALRAMAQDAGGVTSRVWWGGLCGGDQKWPTHPHSTTAKPHHDILMTCTE